MGKIYDSTAYGRIDNLLDQHEEKLQSIDNELFQNKDIARYGIILFVSIVAISVFAYYVKKKK